MEVTVLEYASTESSHKFFSAIENTGSVEAVERAPYLRMTYHRYMRHQSVHLIHCSYWQSFLRTGFRTWRLPSNAALFIQAEICTLRSPSSPWKRFRHAERGSRWQCRAKCQEDGEGKEKVGRQAVRPRKHWAKISPERSLQRQKWSAKWSILKDPWIKDHRGA